VIGQRVDRRADSGEHRRIDGVHLVGARKAHIGDLVDDGDGDAVVHSSSCLTRVPAKAGTQSHKRCAQ
jgi:hypothetical protein